MAATHQRVLRIKLDLSKIEHVLDLQTWRGNETRFELGLFKDGKVVDTSGIESVNCKIRSGRLSEVILADKTVVLSDTELTSVAWASAESASAEMSFTNSEMNLELAGRECAKFYIVFTAVGVGGGEQTLAAGEIKFLEDNNGAGDPPAENPGAALTLGQADARYLQDVDVLAVVEGEYGDPGADFVRIFEAGLN